MSTFVDDEVVLSIANSALPSSGLAERPGEKAEGDGLTSDRLLDVGGEEEEGCEWAQQEEVDMEGKGEEGMPATLGGDTGGVEMDDISLMHSLHNIRKDRPPSVLVYEDRSAIVCHIAAASLSIRPCSTLIYYIHILPTLISPPFPSLQSMRGFPFGDSAPVTSHITIVTASFPAAALAIP
ncbi:hypothetical protein BDQ17DRAFT_1424153 [Cyathus striatus]|nr:hypothetical protein BDQ17DRAFT_1424153 [Cyathus striatus]